jgi:hypothetical protein
MCVISLVKIDETLNGIVINVLFDAKHHKAQIGRIIPRGLHKEFKLDSKKYTRVLITYRKAFLKLLYEGLVNPTDQVLIAGLRQSQSIDVKNYWII